MLLVGLYQDLVEQENLHDIEGNSQFSITLDEDTHNKDIGDCSGDMVRKNVRVTYIQATKTFHFPTEQETVNQHSTKYTLLTCTLRSSYIIAEPDLMLFCHLIEN